MEHTEEPGEHTEEQIPEEIPEKPRKKMTFTEEQLAKKRASMEKARQHRNKNATQFKNEIKELKEKLKEEDEPETVVVKPQPKTKIIYKEKPKPKTKIVYEEEDDDEEEYEEVIVRRRPKTVNKQIEVQSQRPDLLDETYKEKLQKQLRDERQRYIMADLFDF